MDSFVSNIQAAAKTGEVLRVGVDGRHLGLEGGTGVATYARNLTYALQAIGAQVHMLYGPRARMSKRDILNEVAIFDANPGQERLSPQGWLASVFAPMGRTAYPIRPSGELILDHLRTRLPHFDVLWTSQDIFSMANRAFRMSGRITPMTLSPTAPPPHVMHWTFPTPIRARGVANVYTIHDLVPLRLPFTTLDKKRHFYRLVRKLALEADHIVTVSETSREDIIRLLGVAPARVTNTYQAVSIPPALTAKSLDEAAAEVQAVFDAAQNGYFLFIGAVEPKKNIARMIQAYLASGVTLPLIMVGQGGWMEEQELALIEGAHVPRTMAKRVRRYGKVPFPLLVSLIRCARGLVFPSIYEGFGLPALEAMLLGVPVITSNNGALKEVAGDAALLVDPYDAEAISRAFRTMAADEDLCAELRLRGPVQAARFSQDIYATRLRDLYARLA